MIAGYLRLRISQKKSKLKKKIGIVLVTFEYGCMLDLKNCTLLNTFQKNLKVRILENFASILLWHFVLYCKWCRHCLV